MQSGASADGRARLISRLAPWRRTAAFVAVLAALCVGLAAAAVALIARRHDVALDGGAPSAGSGSALLAAAAAGCCAAACAWLELGARRRGFCERLDERLGLQGAWCAAVDGAPTRLSDALASGLSARVTQGAMAGAACARLWPALFVLCGSGVGWLASESWLAPRADGVGTSPSSMAAVADDLQRAALDARASEVRARLAATAAAARRLSVAEREGSAEDAARARAKLLAELDALESATQAVQADEASRATSAASRARLALESGGWTERAHAERRGAGATADASSTPAGRTGGGGGSQSALGEAGTGAAAPGSGLQATETGGAGLASGASGGTISTPELSRGPLLAPTVLETLPAHEAGWLSEWASRARAADAPPR